MLAAVRAAVMPRATIGPGGEAVCVSHQLPIVIARRAAEGQHLFHDPRRRQCSLASVTSFTFEDDGIVRIDYAEPAAALPSGHGAAPDSPCQDAHRGCPDPQRREVGVGVHRRVPHTGPMKPRSAVALRCRCPGGRCGHVRPDGVHGQGRGGPDGGRAVPVRQRHRPAARPTPWPSERRPAISPGTCSTAGRSPCRRTRARWS